MTAGLWLGCLGTGVSLLAGLLGAGGPERQAFRVALAEAEGRAPYQTPEGTPLRSARAKVEDLGQDCQVLSLCLSDLDGVTCANAKGVAVTNPHFVLIVGIKLRTGEVAHPGDWKDLGVVLRTSSGTFAAHGELGTVTLRDTSAEVAGTLQLRQGRLQVTGAFSATRE